MAIASAGKLVGAYTSNCALFGLIWLFSDFLVKIRAIAVALRDFQLKKYPIAE
ncbi:hypothetical protein [Nostoc parmelioides]|uniref:Uncharacterized protein n=1 Tax=Nostoc parmelioides FACHB-3921 TaxID=2692909 RepID=A0ABR8BIB8_9NOSO|nr:hypothetical protein [Nostoc parmelioides]MBD2253858.1 hypothetical protein [Nostoc parmelioides FACHB-3921]